MGYYYEYYIITYFLSVSLFTSPNLIEHDICYFETNLLVVICQEVFSRLRDDTHYENYLYLNYDAHKKDINTEDKCEKVVVEVHVEFPPSVKPFSTEQFGLFCYAGEPIISDYELSPESYPFYKKIMIYPVDRKGIRVFENIPNTSKYRFVRKLNNFSWKRYKPISIDNIQIPKTVDFSEEYLQNLITGRSISRT